MARVEIELNGRVYPIACADGEEERVHAVAALVEERIAQIRGARGSVTETHLLVMVCLMLGDELMDVRDGLRPPPVIPAAEPAATADAGAAPSPAQPAFDAAEDAALRLALARLIDRVEDIAARVEAA